MAQRFRKLPPKQNAGIDDVKRELSALAAWSRQMGYTTVTPRLEWAIEVLTHYKNAKD